MFDTSTVWMAPLSTTPEVEAFSSILCLPLSASDEGLYLFTPATSQFSNSLLLNIISKLGFFSKFSLPITKNGCKHSRRQRETKRGDPAIVAIMLLPSSLEKIPQSPPPHSFSFYLIKLASEQQLWGREDVGQYKEAGITRVRRAAAERSGKTKERERERERDGKEKKRKGKN
mmetsp:Transcript_20469/g.52567  ORF Transcript_20469/g.52567 Transcript_20469/m.52567 type:complete len:173 (+) Transcript_20469:2312-2830(+)